jgi:ABC-type branched-subunit amino acid transport system substrate-binding protein
MFRRTHHTLISAAGFLLLAANLALSRTPEPAFSSKAEELFSKGLESYKSGRYSRARGSFEKVLEFPLSHRSSAAQLMLARTMFRLGEYEVSLNISKRLQRKFSGSRYLFDAHLIAGHSYYVMKRYYEAATQYGRILAMPAPLSLQARAAQHLAAIVRNSLISGEAFERIRQDVGAQRVDDALRFGEYRWYRRLGWADQSQAALAKYRREMPNGIFANYEEVALEELVPEDAATSERNPAIGQWHKGVNVISEDKRPGLPRLGILLPLYDTLAVDRMTERLNMGQEPTLGEDLLAGIQLANDEAGKPFDLIVADTGLEYGELPIAESESNKLLRTVLAARHLIEQEDVLAIIGPVFSSPSVAAAVVAEAAGVPMIAPLAQQSGLDTLGSNIFQLNVIPEVQGQVLAEYATLVFGLETLAVIAPLSDYGLAFEQEFVKVATANGGNVASVNWYYSGRTKDFRGVFEEIREVGFSLRPPAPPDSLVEIDSLTIGELDTLFLGELGLEESLLPEDDESEVLAEPDSSEMFIEEIDAIIIVIEDFGDAETIVPQLYFHRLETQIMGNDIWNNPDAIRRLRRMDRDHFKGTLLVARRPHSDPVSRRFVDAFRVQFGSDPVFAANGFDAARLVISGWEEGMRTRSELRDWLNTVQGFKGASGLLSFPQGRRSNNELVLLKIDQRSRIREVGVEDLPDLSAAHDLPQADLPREVLPEGAAEAPDLE